MVLDMASHLYTNPPQNLHFISSSSSLKPHLCLSFKRINPKHKSSSSSVFVPYASQSSIAITSKERWSLNGMSALVTGGTRGIGRAIVEELAGLGAEVHTCARNEYELENCLSDWNRSGFRVAGSVCDVSDRSQREALMETVSSVFEGKLHILVNNVGTNIRKPMVEFTAGEFSTLMSTNFESVFHLCQLAYPLLRESKAGSVVFISSVSGFVSLKNMSVQSSTKGAINQLTRSLACEWAKDNIRINAVAPWYIKTSMVEQVLSNKEYLEEVYSVTPLGRLGEPREVSNAGKCIAKPTTKYAVEDFSLLIATNLESAFHLSQLANPLLKASGSGSIVLTSSVDGVVHLRVGSIYGATEATFLNDKDAKEKVESRPPMGRVGGAIVNVFSFKTLP